MENENKRKDTLPECPRCGSQDLWRHGKSRSGKRQWFCKSCNKVFVVEPHLPEWVKVVAARMIEEGVKVPKISAVLRGYVSRRWLYNLRSKIVK